MFHSNHTTKSLQISVSLINLLNVSFKTWYTLYNGFSSFSVVYYLTHTFRKNVYIYSKGEQSYANTYIAVLGIKGFFAVSFYIV